MNEFYVYCYLDPRKPGKYSYEGIDICFLYEPFYIGKGKGNRVTEHLSNYELNSKNRTRHNPIKNKKIKDILIFGIDPYYFKISENISDDESIRMEITLIEKIGKIVTKSGPLSNISDGGAGGDNMKYLDPIRKKEIYDYQSNIFKGRKWNGPESGTIISQYDLDGSFMKEWRSISKASKELGIHKYTIIQNVKGVGYHSAGGFIFKSGNTNKINPAKLSTKCIIQFDMNDILIREWQSLKQASESLGIRISGISMCCNGKYKHSGGFKWKLKENYDKERT